MLLRRSRLCAACVQVATESIPLVMEPRSNFYTAPVVVLDFRSLYPSIIIAYNMCYSTCLGKLAAPGKKKFGVASVDVRHKTLAKHHDDLFISPNGVMFLPKRGRVGILGRTTWNRRRLPVCFVPSEQQCLADFRMALGLLSEILHTRNEVKRVMKTAAANGDQNLYRTRHFSRIIIV